MIITEYSQSHLHFCWDAFFFFACLGYHLKYIFNVGGAFNVYFTLLKKN